MNEHDYGPAAPQGLWITTDPQKYLSENQALDCSAPPIPGTDAGIMGEVVYLLADVVASPHPGAPVDLKLSVVNGAVRISGHTPSRMHHAKVQDAVEKIKRIDSVIGVDISGVTSP